MLKFRTFLQVAVLSQVAVSANSYHAPKQGRIIDVMTIRALSVLSLWRQKAADAVVVNIIHAL